MGSDSAPVDRPRRTAPSPPPRRASAVIRSIPSVSIVHPKMGYAGELREDAYAVKDVMDVT